MPESRASSMCDWDRIEQSAERNYNERGEYGRTRGRVDSLCLRHVGGGLSVGNEESYPALEIPDESTTGQSVTPTRQSSPASSTRDRIESPSLNHPSHPEGGPFQSGWSFPNQRPHHNNSTRRRWRHHPQSRQGHNITDNSNQDSISETYYSSRQSPCSSHHHGYAPSATTFEHEGNDGPREGNDTEVDDFDERNSTYHTPPPASEQSSTDVNYEPADDNGAPQSPYPFSHIDPHNPEYSEKIVQDFDRVNQRQGR